MDNGGHDGHTYKTTTRIMMSVKWGKLSGPVSYCFQNFRKIFQEKTTFETRKHSVLELNCHFFFENNSLQTTGRRKKRLLFAEIFAKRGGGRPLSANVSKKLVVFFQSSETPRRGKKH